MLISKPLRVFITLYQEKRLKAAADKLCLTVPPVTRMLKLTEEWLGERLFVIERNSLSPTSAADGLYQKVFPLYSAMLEFEHPWHKKGFRISSPNAGRTVIADLLTMMSSSLPESADIRFSRGMHADDDVFISIEPSMVLPNFETFRTDLTMELHYAMQGDEDWHKKPLLCEAVIESLPGFQRVIDELKQCGHCGMTRRIDNAIILENIFMNGEGLLFRKPIKAKNECRTLPFILHVPFYIYTNSVSMNNNHRHFVEILKKTLS